MGLVKLDLSAFPPYLIAEDAVFKLAVEEIPYGGRAFTRGLKDVRVEGSDLLSGRRWTTVLGISEELEEDYPSMRLPLPLEVLMVRFLNHHLRSNTIDLLSGPGGPVLTTDSAPAYLGSDLSPEDGARVLLQLVRTWIPALGDAPIAPAALAASSDLSPLSIRKAVNLLAASGTVQRVTGGAIKPLPHAVQAQLGVGQPLRPADRRATRYFQETRIQAESPFCFVLMPFRDSEFRQSTYTGHIKPLLEDAFGIRCYNVGEDHLPDRIDNKIYTYLLNSAFVVAEITSRNPNVMYELGLAHMLEKDCIILTQSAPHEAPFDINKIRIDRYQSPEELTTALERSVVALGFRRRPL